MIRSALGRHRARPGSPALRAGVKKGSNNISWGTMPIDRLALRGCSSMSKPQISALPLDLHDQSGEDIDQGRLAGAIGPEQPENLAARHVEADLVQRALRIRPGGIGLAQASRCGSRLDSCPIGIAGPVLRESQSANEAFT